MPHKKNPDALPDDITRYTIVIRNKHQEKLAKIAKAHKISQSEMLETMLDHLDMERMAPIFDRVREEKVAGRVTKTALLKRLAMLDTDQLEQLVAQKEAQPQ